MYKRYKHYLIGLLLITAHGLCADTPSQDDDLARLRAAYDQKQHPQPTQKQQPEDDEDAPGGLRKFIKDFIVGYATGYTLTKGSILVSSHPENDVPHKKIAFGALVYAAGWQVPRFFNFIINAIL